MIENVKDCLKLEVLLHLNPLCQYIGSNTFSFPQRDFITLNLFLWNLKLYLLFLQIEN